METRYTTYCTHVHQLTQDVRKMITDVIVPAAEARCRDNPAAEPAHYRVIHYPFLRIVRWLTTFERVNQTNDMQAIGAGARGVFEHYIDLQWLERFPDEIWFERFRIFVDVDRYVAARKVVDHKHKHPDSKVHAEPHQRMMDRLDAKEPMDARVARVWGSDAKGNARWPRDHWTGMRSLRERAREIGMDCEDAYVQFYPTLCALIHSGPSPEHGNFEWFETQVAFGYYFTFRHAKMAAETFSNLLDLRPLMPTFDERMRELERWADTAADHNPNAPPSAAT